MKSIISIVMATIFLTFPLSSFAVELYKPVQCFTVDNPFQVLEKDFGEKPIFISVNGMNGNTSIALLYNKITGTWTLIEYTKNDVCILGSGKNTPT